MSIVASQLVAKVAVEGAVAAEAQLDGVNKKVNSTSSGFGALKGPALLAGAAIIGIGLASAKMAGDFNSGMTSLVTGAGESSTNIGLVSAGILKMAVDTGTTTQQLTAGMFMIESAGQHGAQGLATLQAAAEGAKVGQADLGVVADGTTTIMTDFASKNISASQAVNYLVATVASGKTHMQDLAGSLSSILPTASSVKVGLTDVMAAMATMTGEGVPAADAATYLRQTLMTLASPAKAGAKALADIGLSAQQVSDGMKVSLPGTLAMIEDHLKKKFPEGSIAYQDALKNIAGGSKQMQGILDLTGTHMETFKKNVGGIASSVKQGGNSITGWSDVQKDFNFKMSQAGEVVQTLMITIGQNLLPVIGQIVGAVAPVISQFAAWISNAGNAKIALAVLGGVLAGLATILIGSVVPSLAATIIAAWPLLAVAAGVALAITGVILAVQHWGAISASFMPVLKQIGDLLKTYVLPIIQELGSFIVSQFAPVWQGLVQLWNGQLLPLFKQLWTAIQPLLPLFQFIAGLVGGIVVVAFVNLVGIIHGVVAAVATIISDIGSAIGGVVRIITGIVQVISGILSFIKDLFTGNWKALGGDLRGIWQGIVNVFGGIFQVMGSIIHGIFGGIGSFIGGFVQGVMNTIGNLLGAADRARIQAEVQQTQMKLNSINTAIQTSQKVLAVEDAKRQGILKELENTKDPKKRAELEMQLHAVTTKEQEAQKVIEQEKLKKEGVLKHLADLKQQQEEANKNIFQKTADWFGQTKDKAVQLFGQMKDGIGQKLTDLRNTVGGWFSNFGGWFHQQCQNVVDDFKNVFGQIGGIFTGIWNDIVGGVKGLVNNFIGIINGIINHVNGITKYVGIPAIPDIPLLARGGDVVQGGWGIVGDQGPEALYLPQGARVIPNNQLGALASGGGAQQSSGGSNQPLILQIDGRTFARLILPHVVNTIRANVGVQGY